MLAAFYLREYAKQGPFVSAVRIAVNNLAGVPSIVFGVFGVGFFIYFVGGTIDRLFYAEALPTPTYGTGGILWASLTLALLTVPVVIVATEEGLAAIPRGMREASLALSATKLETTLRVVLPAVMPSILTGLILAMARAAGRGGAAHDHRGGQARAVACPSTAPGRSCTSTGSSCTSAFTSTTWASSRPTWTRRGPWSSRRPCSCSASWCSSTSSPSALRNRLRRKYATSAV